MTSDFTRNLIILGNGFDMHCGLQSSFSQFFNKMFLGEEEVSANLYKEFHRHLFDNAGEGLSSKFRKSSIFELLVLSCFHHLNLVDMHCYDESDKKLSSQLDYRDFWHSYFFFLKPYYKSTTWLKDTNWSDVELQLSHFFEIFSKSLEDYLRILKKYINNANGKHRDDVKLVNNLSNDLFKLRTTQELNINVINSHVNYKSELNSRFFMLNIIVYILIKSGYHLKDDLYEFLLHKLYIFEDELKTYLKEEPIGNMGRLLYRTNIINTLNELDYNNENYNILTFNYTRYPDIQHSLKHFRKIRNIHSTIKDHPIIGIGSLNNKDYRQKNTSFKYFRFTKTYRIMKLSKHTNNFYHILPDTIKNIIFYGHSLALADYPYFKAIFDKYDIENNCNLIFYYSTNFNRGDKEEKSQFDHVFKLINEYDNTGDLLTKLLIEGRLHVKELPNRIFKLKQVGNIAEAKYYKDSNNRDEMKILKGSKVSKQGSMKSLSKNRHHDYMILKTLRGNVIKSNEFTRDQSEVPSTAASIILRGSYDGLKAWQQKKNGNFISLKEFKNINSLN